jgi:hypothetical protein
MRAGARDTGLGRTQRKRRSELGYLFQPKSDLSDFGRLKCRTWPSRSAVREGGEPANAGKSCKGFL